MECTQCENLQIIFLDEAPSSIDKDISATDSKLDQIVTSLEKKSENFLKNLEKTLNETAQSILESKAVAEESYPEQGKKNLTFLNALDLRTLN